MTRLILSIVLATSLVTPAIVIGDAKLDIPDNASRAAKRELINAIYKPDYLRAQSREQKIALAKRLTRVATETKDDPVGKFVLLRIARDIASEQRDIETAMSTIDSLGSTFQIDALSMKATVLGRAGNQRLTMKEYRELGPAMVEVLQRCIDSDRYDIGIPLAQVATNVAAKAKDREIEEAISDLAQQIERLADAFQAIEESQAALRLSALDSHANLEVGRYYCLEKQDWKRGVPLLALSEDEALRRVAEKELAANAKPLDIGDGWWEFAEGMNNPHGDRIREHAANWYRQSLGELNGLEKARVEFRIKDIQPTVDVPSPAPGKPEHALVFDGRTTYVRIPGYKYEARYPLTIEAILKVDTPPANHQVICGSQDDAGFGLFRARDGYWNFAMRANGGGYRSARSNSIAEIGKWIHVAGIYDGQRVQLFVNGKIQSNSQTVPGGHKVSQISVHVGVNPGRVPSEFFHGQIKEFRISSVVRYRRNFRVPTKLESDSNTVTLYKFNEPNSKVAVDLSKPIQNGEIIGGQWVQVD